MWDAKALVSFERGTRILHETGRGGSSGVPLAGKQGTGAGVTREWRLDQVLGFWILAQGQMEDKRDKR